MTSVLTTKLNELMSEKLEDARITQLLDAYGLEQRQVRKEGGPRRCWIVAADRVNDLLARYCAM